jgi:N-acetylmuramoyl-L-alanine amidase
MRTDGVSRGTAVVIYCLVMLASAFIAASSLVASSPGAVAAEQQDVSGSKVRTRFVIGLDKAVEPRVFALANPSRVIVDLPDVAVSLPALPKGEQVGLVRSIRGGLAAADRFRVILEVSEPVVIERSAVEAAPGGKGQRLVVEIVPVEGRAAGKAPQAPAADTEVRPVRVAAVQPPSPKRAERPEARAKRSARPVIVLDPGHGGMDSGAVRNGAVEKDVVLAFSLVLRDKLNATGRYRVLMTRDSDKFVDLDERREFAEENEAALFMAIHADSAGAGASGATVYSLREGVAEGLKNSARREIVNSVLKDRQLRDLGKGGDAEVVRSMLGGLAEKDILANPSKTSVFARSLIDYMSASTTMMSNPDRQAAFRVLQTAKVPAVLVELAFVTNRQDAQKLMSDAWRAKVADSLVTAIEAYFANPASSPLR